MGDFGSLFDFLSGESVPKIGIDMQSIALLGLVIMIAIFIGVFIANKVS